jgi:hypothetical protein
MEVKTFLQTVYPVKFSKFGIKSYELGESSLGYLCSFITYTGKDTVLKTACISDGTNKTSAVVLSLVELLLRRGHTLWVASFDNSPALA